MATRTDLTLSPAETGNHSDQDTLAFSSGSVPPSPESTSTSTPIPTSDATSGSRAKDVCVPDEIVRFHRLGRV
ncbi:hypothetical protein SBRCBS47491_005825 [Sporothrix bragantina]|uniref:Uncharacterized protein n=1 Tax=Sporothrix bragantina TaxID=671064 RepID=A0ABP0C0T8_9PEZI